MLRKQIAQVRRFGVVIGGFALVIGLASLLIGGIMLRSPDTHGNLWETASASYDRTLLSFVGKTTGEIEPAKAQNYQTIGNPVPVDPGRAVYLANGCGNCHGADARGGVVGTSLTGAIPEMVKKVVRHGPGGMPAFTENTLSDDDLDKLTTYLKGLAVTKPSFEELSSLQKLVYDPAIPRGVLLEGKAAMRRSCGACHEPPSKYEMSGGFDVGGLMADMVRETNLSLADAQLIGNYMLAIRNGNDPVESP